MTESKENFHAKKIPFTEYSYDKNTMHQKLYEKNHQKSPMKETLLTEISYDKNPMKETLMKES